MDCFTSTDSSMTGPQTRRKCAGNNANAIVFYEDAIRATQFEGESREGSKFREWKKKEGDKLKARELQNAIRLHLNYIALTLQRSAGASISELVPALINYTKQV